jgi:hypothetical protein
MNPTPRRSVLSAIYDGPMDVVEYGYEPIILEKIPTLMTAMHWSTWSA